MKKMRILDIAAVILGGFAFVAYISYFIKLVIWPEGTFPLAVCIAVMILSLVPIVFHRGLAKIIPDGIFTCLKCIYLFAAVLYAVTFISLVVYIYSTIGAQVSPDEIRDDSVIIVYGAGLRDDGKPDKALVRRLDASLRLAGDRTPYIIVSGAQGEYEIRTEASAMKEYLIEKGYPEDKIITEEMATDTKENVKYSFEIIEEKGLGDSTVVSVSNKFHVPRIRLICEMYGCETEVFAADDPAGGTVFASLVREYMSYVKLFIRGRS